VAYTWYLDGVEAKNRKGEIASTSNILNLGWSQLEVAVHPGPHVLMVRVDAGLKTFSDYYYFRASDTGTIGSSDYIPSIGERGLSGGFVFYDKGSYSDGWRYLEVAPTDILIGTSDYLHIFGYYRTYPAGSPVTVGTLTDIGTGQANTAALVAAMGSTAYISRSSSTTTTTADYAARLCDNLVIGDYDDWFLPSKDELGLMYDNLKANGVGGFSGIFYWSSSEYDADDAWGHVFANGEQRYNDDFFGNCVRAVRAF
jgi:hypothetical protein